MTITHTDLIAHRRQIVYELHWKGLSVREIAKELGNVSFKTVALDLEYLRKTAEATMLKQRRYLALEHQEACEVYRYLLRKALEQFDKADKEKDDDRKERLYPIIESINANLVATRSTRDIVETEIKDAKEKANKLQKEMKITVTNNDKASGQSD